MRLTERLRRLFRPAASRRREPVLCTLCAADWAAGAFGANCPECDGGALARRQN